MTDAGSIDLVRLLWTIGPGLICALLVLALLGLGYRWGRRTPPAGLRALERYLRSLAAGREEIPPEPRRGDPATASIVAAVDLARALRERHGAHERRLLLAGAASEALPGRGSLIVDRDGIVLQASDAVGRLVGLRAGDLEGAPLSSFFSVESWRSFLPHYAERAQRQRGFSAALELIRHDAPALPVRVHVVEAPEPHNAAVLWVEPDPLYRSDAEQLARERAELRELFEAGLDGVIVVASGGVLYANSAAERQWGGALSGQRLRDLVVAEDLLLVTDRAARAERGETVAPLRARLQPRAAGAALRHVEIHARGLQSGDVPHAVLVVRDLTQTRQVQQQARVYQARLAAVLDAVGDGIVLLTPAGPTEVGWRVGLVNDCVSRLFGSEAAHWPGLAGAEFAARLASRFREPAALTDFLDKAWSGADPVPRASFDLATEPTRTVELALTPVVTSAGEAAGRLLIVTDITRHRETERRLQADAATLVRSREALQRAYEELALVHRDLEKQSAELDKVNRELTALDQARAQLLADVTHELQTPLVSIRGYTQMILEGRLGSINDEQRRGLEVALRNVDRMVELINNLLALARSENSAALQLEPVDVEATIEAVFARVEGQARRKNVELARRVAPGLKAAAERDGLSLVLENLVSNGIKFNRTAGRVIVTAGEGEPGFLTIDVEDTGAGIPADERARVFERFFRGKSAAGVPGSGIGLATVQNVIQRHGGRIEVLAAPGGGALFRISWPKAEGQTLRVAAS